MRYNVLLGGGGQSCIIFLKANHITNKGARNNAPLCETQWSMHSMLMLGGWGHASPGKFWKIDGLRLNLRAFQGLAVFSEDIAFACHIVAPYPPPPSHPIGVLVVLAPPVKKLSKMVGNSASYPVYSKHSELPWIAIHLWRNMCRQL